MSSFKPQQRVLTVRGRELHFVSYEGRQANPRRGEEASPDMWYLMCEGRRCAVLPCEPSQSLAALDDALRAWAEKNAFGPGEASGSITQSGRSASNRGYENWWGPN